MSAFLSWFASTIGQWWQFLVDTDVPGLSFSFATLFLGAFFLNFSIFILQFIIRKDNGGKESK